MQSITHSQGNDNTVTREGKREPDKTQEYQIQKVPEAQDHLLLPGHRQAGHSPAGHSILPPAHPVQRTAVLCSIIFPLDLLLFLSPENILPSPSPPVPDHPGMTSCRCHTARRPMNIRFPRSRQSVRHKHLTKKHTLYLLTGVIPVPREFINTEWLEKPDTIVMM